MSRKAPPNDAVKIKVYTSVQVYNHETPTERYGSWFKDSSSEIDKVILDDGETDWNAETFVIAAGSTKAHVVYMIYNTGDSFGRATGEIDVMHAFGSREKAEELAAHIRANENEYSINFTDDFGRDISISNSGAGYFESIQGIYVETFDIGEYRKKSF